MLLLIAHAARAQTTSTATVSTDDRRRALLLADLLIEEGRLDEAESFLGERQALEGRRVDLGMRWARLRAAQKRHADAAELYEDLLRDSPDDSGLRLQLGLERWASGELEAARRAFEKARAGSADPRLPYYLSELAWSRGDRGEARRLAREALDAPGWEDKLSDDRARLRLRARLGWEDAVHDAYGRLFDENPRDPEILEDWTHALLEAGHPEAASEPLALLGEGFPKLEHRWARLEADRLRAAQDEDGLAAHLERWAPRHPKDGSLSLGLASLELKRRRWDLAEDYALRAEAASPDARRGARQTLAEARLQGHHHAGPTFRWRQSNGSRLVETGAEYHGYPRPGLRAEADAGRGEYTVRSRGGRSLLSGLRAAAALERPRWTAGLEADLRSGGHRTLLSPGVFGAWREALWSAEAEASANRAWRDSAEAVASGTAADELAVSARLRPLPRLSLGARHALTRLRVQGGGGATQAVTAPEAAVILLHQPLYVSLAYRFVSVDVAGEDAFFRALPLLRRARTQYGVLSVGRWWLDGRLRADAYAFNGHEPGRGFRFGTSELVGYGVNLEWLAGPWRLRAGYDSTREDTLGVGGRSQGARLAAQWRWRPAVRRTPL